MNFLGEVFDGDEELVAFMLRAAGRALTGETREHKLFFLYGEHTSMNWPVRPAGSRPSSVIEFIPDLAVSDLSEGLSSLGPNARGRVLTSL